MQNWKQYYENMLQKENNVQLDKNYERRKETTDFSSYWDPSIHNEISQVKSRVTAKKIKSSDITMNADNSCFISGSGSEPYHVTLSSCQCQDFAVNKKRERPCKHIYRLASELGMFDLLPEKTRLEQRPFRKKYRTIWKNGNVNSFAGIFPRKRMSK